MNMGHVFIQQKICAKYLPRFMNMIMCLSICMFTNNFITLRLWNGILQPCRSTCISYQSFEREFDNSFWWFSQRLCDFENYYTRSWSNKLVMDWVIGVLWCINFGWCSGMVYQFENITTTFISWGKVSFIWDFLLVNFLMEL